MTSFWCDWFNINDKSFVAIGSIWQLALCKFDQQELVMVNYVCGFCSITQRKWQMATPLSHVVPACIGTLNCYVIGLQFYPIRNRKDFEWIIMFIIIMATTVHMFWLASERALFSCNDRELWNFFLAWRLFLVVSKTMCTRAKTTEKMAKVQLHFQ